MMIENVTTSFDMYKYLPSTVCNVLSIILPIGFLYFLHKHNNSKIYKIYTTLTIVLLIVSSLITFRRSILDNCGVICYDPNPMEIITMPIILLSYIIACPVGNNLKRLIISLIPSILLFLYIMFAHTVSITLVVNLLLVIMITQFFLLPVYFHKK